MAPAPTEPEALELEDIPVPSRERAASQIAANYRRGLEGMPRTIVSFETGLERREEQERVWWAIQGSANPVHLRGVETFTGKTKRLREPVALDDSEDSAEGAAVVEKDHDKRALAKIDEQMQKKRMLNTYIPHHYPDEQMWFYKSRFGDNEGKKRKIDVENVECERCLNYAFCRAKSRYILKNTQSGTWMCRLCLHIVHTLTPAERVVRDVACYTVQRTDPEHRRARVLYPRPYRLRVLPVLTLPLPPAMMKP